MNVQSYRTVYRITYYILRLTLYGFLNVALSSFGEIGCKGCEETLQIIKQEQRDCEKVHHNIRRGVWKLFVTAVGFVLISR